MDRSHQLKRYAIYGSIAVTASLGTLLAVRARAAGIPDADVLTYTGYLEDADGAPLTGTYAIDVTFYGSVDGTDDLCTGEVNNAALVSGRFQVPLPDCVVEVQGNPNIWVEVEVDSASLGRTKLGAVPYALEAGRASDSAGTLEQRLAALEAAALGKSMFHAWKTTPQFATSDAFHKVLFDQETFDAAGEFTISEGPVDATDSTFKVVTAGQYLVGCNVTWDINAAGIAAGYFGISIWANDTRVLESGFNSDGQYATRSIRTTLQLAADDVVDCRVYHASGGSRDIDVSAAHYANFEAVRLAL